MGRQRRAGRDPAGEGLLRVLVTEIDEGVSVLAHEDGDDQPGNRDILPDIFGCIGRIDLGSSAERRGPAESANISNKSWGTHVPPYGCCRRKLRLNPY
jgi:hypothetical protein